MPLCRKKGEYPTSNNVGSVCKSLPFRFWELFSCGVPEGESDPGGQAPTTSLMSNLEGSRFIIRVWGGKPHRKKTHSHTIRCIGA